MKADLHLHTTASDGVLNPQDLVRLAVTLGLDVIAITDHDTVDGIVPALAAVRDFPSLTVIPGVEISIDLPHGEIHILGYFIDYTNQKLVVSLQELRGSRQGRALKMISKLHTLGMDITWDRVQELAQGGSIGRPHIAQALLEGKYIDSTREAFDKYIGRNGPAYVEREKLTPVDAVKLIINAHGLPVLAHPADIQDLDKSITELKAAGLTGMEVYYGNYSPDTISRLLTLARQYELIPTGGSDYHGFGDSLEVMVGETSVPASSVEQLISLAGKLSPKLTNI